MRYFAFCYTVRENIKSLKNAEFYTRHELGQSVSKKRGKPIKWKQLLAFAALFVFFAPFLPTRRRLLQSDFPTDWFDYLAKAGIVALIVATILFILFICEQTRFTSVSYHYKLVGVFEVKEKILKPKKRIILHPGTGHLASVDSKLFHQLTVGDKVHVERRLTGELISIRKL